MKKIMLVFGTRPEAIKMLPLVKAFEKDKANFQTLVCVTGQHREMLDQVLQLFKVIPHYDLNIMQKGQDLYDITSKVLLGMREILQKEKPDLVFVHGDTTTSTATALASFYQQIPIAHIEAGLRTNDILSPWPEEANRQLTARLTTYHFSPTPLSKTNLEKEHINPQHIYVTGNTVIDALHWVIAKIRNEGSLQTLIQTNIAKMGYDTACAQTRKLVLITGHRRENFGSGFLQICKALKQLSETFPKVDFVYPMHLNPNVRKPIEEVFLTSKNKTNNIFFIEPLGYLEFVFLMDKSTLVLTDSGGIQEEAPGLGKPVLVMRNTTERPEALEAGTVKLVGTSQDKIVKEVTDLLTNEDYYRQMSQAVNPYGDGKACERILTIIKNN